MKISVTFDSYGQYVDPVINLPGVVDLSNRTLTMKVRLVSGTFTAWSQGGVQFHALRSRQAGARQFISFHVLVPGGWTVQQGHNLLEEIEEQIHAALPASTIFTHLGENVAAEAYLTGSGRDVDRPRVSGDQPELGSNPLGQHGVVDLAPGDAIAHPRADAGRPVAQVARQRVDPVLDVVLGMQQLVANLGPPGRATVRVEEVHRGDAGARRATDLLDPLEEAGWVRDGPDYAAASFGS